MFSTIATKYIILLDEYSIDNLYFPDLYKKELINDCIDDLKLINLKHLKEKIINFKFINAINLLEIIPFPNCRTKYKKLTIELNELYGYSSACSKTNKIKKKHAVIEFKKLLRSNAEFIINNKDRILQKIDEVYNNLNKTQLFNYKEQKNEKIICECGALVSKTNISRHKNTETHISFLINEIS